MSEAKAAAQARERRQAAGARRTATQNVQTHWSEGPDGTDLNWKGWSRNTARHCAVKGIDLEIADGEFVVFVGPSGCGKSTTLRMIAGLEDISGGALKIGDEVVNQREPKQRNIAMVFQNYAIYPHMTVGQNIGFGLYTSKMTQS